MKKVISNVLDRYPDSYYESLTELEGLLKQYFVTIRSHTFERTFVPYLATFYPHSTPPLTYKKVGEISITVPCFPPGIFYDWQGNVVEAEDGEPAIQIDVNGRFAGLYFPHLHSLYATDWSHDKVCVEVAREVVPHLAEALGLKPLTEAEREKARRRQMRALRRTNTVSVTVGGDPEFEMWRKGRTLRAEHYLGYEGSIGVDGSGRQVELRPAPGTPVQVVRSLRQLIKEFAEDFPECDLDAAGHKYPCGGHIHIGGVPDGEPPGKLLELLDDFLGRPSLPLSGDARGSYRRLSAWESKPWGFEYRTPPAAVFSNPRVARIVLKLVRNLVARFYSGRAIEYNDPPGMEDYVRVGGLTEKEAVYLVEFFRRGCPESLRILAAWGVPGSKERLEVSFRDDWLPERKRWFREALLKRLRKGKVVLYGLASSRGFAATVPGIPGAAMLDNPPHAPLDRQGRVWVGLPWTLRMEEDADESLLRNAAEAIVRYCRQQLKNRR